MSSDTSVVVVEKTPAPQEIDRVLRRIAVAQAALDADEAHWLRLADEQNIWSALGYVHALEYLEDVFGYAPKTAQERLRVARELGVLPQLEDALRCGELSHSVVRELTRVATPATIDAWLERARGRRLRDVEQMVSGRKKGDEPDAPPDHARVKHRLVLELDGESMAIWRRMQQTVELELEHKVDDCSLVLALADRVLQFDVRDENAMAKPRYTRQIMTCRACKRGWMDGAGVRFEIGGSLLERAACDAIVIDDEQGKRPTRTIPAAIERLVLERAEHRCQVPGCRSSKHLTIHHIVFWSHGGGHDPSNLVVLCDGHHRLLHEGLLRVTGRAPDALLFERNGRRLLGAADVTELLGSEIGRRTSDAHAMRRHVSPPSRRRHPDATVMQNGDDHVALARAALVQLQFKSAEAERAVELASARVGADAELGVLIKEALRQLAPKR